MRVLVLSGGGSRGADQIGRVLALYEKGYRWDAIVGTSVGAINGLGISCLGVEKTARMWERIRSRQLDVMRFNWCWPWNWTGFYSLKPLEGFLTGVLSGAAPKIPVYACSMDLRNYDVRYEFHTSVSEQIRATLDSSAVPVIHAVPNKYWCDGGLREFAPVEMAINALHATEIDVVSTSPLNMPEQEMPTGWWPLSGYLGRAIDALVFETWQRDLVIGRLSLPQDKFRVHCPERMLTLDPLDYCHATLMDVMTAAYEEQMRCLSESGA